MLPDSKTMHGKSKNTPSPVPWFSCLLFSELLVLLLTEEGRGFDLSGFPTAIYVTWLAGCDKFAKERERERERESSANMFFDRRSPFCITNSNRLKSYGLNSIWFPVLLTTCISFFSYCRIFERGWPGCGEVSSWGRHERLRPPQSSRHWRWSSSFILAYQLFGGLLLSDMQMGMKMIHILVWFDK